MRYGGWWRRLRGEWRLEGWDTFAGHPYPIPGRYRSRGRAEAAARRRLAELERTQPSAVSGGPDGVQDHVYVVGPAGERFRVE
jgi:hypothetical protein